MNHDKLIKLCESVSYLEPNKPVHLQGFEFLTAASILSEIITEDLGTPTIHEAIQVDQFLNALKRLAEFAHRIENTPMAENPQMREVIEYIKNEDNFYLPTAQRMAESIEYKFEMTSRNKNVFPSSALSLYGRDGQLKRDDSSKKTR